MFKRKKKRDSDLSFLDNVQTNEAISYENLSIIPLTNNNIDEFKCLPFAEAIAENLASVSEKNQEGTEPDHQLLLRQLHARHCR